tara:strand:- start:94 stop:333 length:240 start_codon:yes stop_codon:yes gene_type:complete
MINPSVAPTKNKGIINPPRHPEVTVMEMAMILKTNSASNNFMGKLPTNNSFISWCPKYLVNGNQNAMQPSKTPPINVLI